MNYTYTHSGQYFDGLPAHDLDDEQLTPEQRAALTRAVELGIYQPAADVTAELVHLENEERAIKVQIEELKAEETTNESNQSNTV